MRNSEAEGTANPEGEGAANAAALLRLRFWPVQTAGWTALWLATTAAALGWWPLGTALVDRGVFALTGLVVSLGLRAGYRRVRPQSPLGLVVLIAGASYAGALVWTFAHTSLTASVYGVGALLDFWQHGGLKRFSGVTLATAVLAAWSVLYHALRPAASSPGTPVPPESVPFVARVTGRRTVVPPDDVVWAEAAGDYVRLHPAPPARSHLVRATMAEVEARLGTAFVRVHRSTLVRADAVREVRLLGRGEAAIVLADGTERRVGRAYRAVLTRWTAPA